MRDLRRQVAVFLALLHVALAVDQPDDGCCVVDSACLTNLALEAQQSPDLLTSFKSVSTAVLACTGAKGAVVRPLRFVMPDYTEVLMAVFLSTLKSTVGWDVEVTYVPANKVGAFVLDTEATGRAYWDAWVTDTTWTLELASQGMIEPLDNYVNADPQVEWLDIPRFLRATSAVFNGSVVGVPIGGAIYLMHWRRDVLARAGVSPPQTWNEVVAVARALNGSDFNADGQPDYSLCLDMFNPAVDDQGALLSQILASMTQTQGTNSGWLFSPETMESFIDTPAMTEALDIVRQLLPYTTRFLRSNNLNTHPFVKGTCALHFASPDVFKATQFFGKLKGRYGSAPLPGSETVLDRKTGTLVDCSTDMCPYATLTNATSTSAPKLVNRASFNAFGSVLAMVNANSLSVYKAAAYRCMALFSSYQIALQVVLAYDAVGPYRQRLLLQSKESLKLWSNRGYNATDVAGYLSATQATLDHPNNALDLRLHGGPEYSLALFQAGQSLTEGMEVAAVQSTASARFAAITSKTPLQQLGDGYVAGLNLKRRFVMPIPLTFPSPASLPAAGSSSGPATGQLVGIIIGSVVGGLLVLALAVALVVARGKTHRRWGFFGTHLPPGVGVGTTLVVTDIENSTLLWEKIEQDVMNIAMELHHTLVRKLLIGHCGYESATEGDSFIAAFHTPLDALQFAQAFQAGLLHLDWPAEVLACELSSPVWVQPGNDLKKSDSTKQFSRSSSATNFQYSMFRSAPQSVTGAVTGTIAAFRSTLDGVGRSTLDGTGRLTLDSRTTGRSVLDGYSSVGMSLTGAPPSPSTYNSVCGPGTEAPLPPASPAPHKRRARVSFANGPIGGVACDREPLDIIASNQSFSTLQGTAFLQQQPAKPQTALTTILDEWTQCDAPLPGGTPGAERWRLAFRGLRVRVGLHSGLHDPREAMLNATTGRMQYSGQFLNTAKAVGDCGHGGMVLISHDCFSALPIASLQSMGLLLNMGEYSFTKGGSEVVKPCALYQVVASDMQHRLAVLEHKLRSVTQLQVGVLQAPVNDACIVFANVVGAAALMAWDADVATKALELFQRTATQMLMANSGAGAMSHGMLHGADMVLGTGGEGGGHEPQPPGYVVELAGGLCLAAFQTPASGLLWALRLIQGLLKADWDPDLLSHDLCEEVCIGGGGGVSVTMAKRAPSVASPASLGEGILLGSGSEFPTTSQRALKRVASMGDHSSARLTRAAQGGLVLLRGLRLKIGVDMGNVHAKVNPCTGRMAYRGRVMNRTARIADKAGSGQVWCSRAVMDAFESSAGPCLNALEAHPLGSFNLKGVTEPVDLMQCVLLQSTLDNEEEDGM